MKNKQSDLKIKLVINKMIKIYKSFLMSFHRYNYIRNQFKNLLEFLQLELKSKFSLKIYFASFDKMLMK